MNKCLPLSSDRNEESHGAVWVGLGEGNWLTTVAPAEGKMRGKAGLGERAKMCGEAGREQSISDLVTRT